MGPRGDFKLGLFFEPVCDPPVGIFRLARYPDHPGLGPDSAFGIGNSADGVILTQKRDPRARRKLHPFGKALNMGGDPVAMLMKHRNRGFARYPVGHDNFHPVKGRINTQFKPRCARTGAQTDRQGSDFGQIDLGFFGCFEHSERFFPKAGRKFAGFCAFLTSTPSWVLPAGSVFLYSALKV